MFKKLTTLTLGFLLTISLAPLALAQDSELTFPEPDGYVTDAADILDNTTENELETKLRNYEGETSTEIAVVTVPSLEGYAIEEYTFELGETWGVGKEGVDNGVVFLIAPTERLTRIEVGYGLEGAIPDITAWGIIQNSVIPHFKNDDYTSGIVAGVDDIIRASRDEDFANQIAGTQSNEHIESLVSSIMIFIFFFMTWFLSVLARSKSWWAGGLFGAVGGIVLTIVTPTAWPWILILAFVGLVLDYFVSKNYKKAGKTSWWAGGGFNSGGGSFSSGGSFGGGSFGGGGASGSW